MIDGQKLISGFAATGASAPIMLKHQKAQLSSISSIHLRMLRISHLFRPFLFPRNALPCLTFHAPIAWVTVACRSKTLGRALLMAMHAASFLHAGAKFFSLAFATAERTAPLRHWLATMKADRATPDAFPMLLRPQPSLKRIAGRTVLRFQLLLGCAASAARVIRLRRMPRLRQIKTWPTGQLSGFRGDLTASVADASAQPRLSALLCTAKAGYAKRTVLGWIATATSGAYTLRMCRNQHLIITFLWCDDPRNAVAWA